MASREADRKMQDELNKLMREHGDAIARQKAYQEKMEAELAKKF